MSRDETANAPTPTHTMGYGPEFRKTLERRNAADCAAHLLPHLKSGMRLLDLGYGPGTISVELAEVVVSPHAAMTASPGSCRGRR